MTETIRGSIQVIDNTITEPKIFITNIPPSGCTLVWNGDNLEWRTDIGRRLRIHGNDPSYIVGSGIELSFTPGDYQYGVIRCVDRSASNTDKDLYIQADDLILSVNDVYTSAPWPDYSAISTIIGWSSFSTKKIFYKQIGKLVFVEFSISGTSNSTSTAFTLPFDRHNNAYSLKVPMQITDSGSVQLGLFEVATNGGTVTCYSTIGEAGWTATGTKGVIGQFWYETT